MPHSIHSNVNVAHTVMVIAYENTGHNARNGKFWNLVTPSAPHSSDLTFITTADIFYVEAHSTVSTIFHNNLHKAFFSVTQERRKIAEKT